MILASALLRLAAGITGCGGPAEPPPVPCPEVDESFGCVDGATLAAMPGAEFKASTAGLVPRVERALRLAGEVWGVEPADHLAGWTIEFSGGWFACGTGARACWTYGCALPDRRIIKAAAGFADCLPGVLIHELGHVVIGDGEHLDPRFATADAMEGGPCE
jgi:hypothetical protein